MVKINYLGKDEHYIFTYRNIKYRVTIRYDGNNYVAIRELKKEEGEWVRRYAGEAILKFFMKHNKEKERGH